MIKTSIEPDGDIKIEIHAEAKNMTEGEELQSCFIGAALGVIRIMRKNNFTDEIIEKMLVEAINDAFNLEEIT